MLILLFNQAAGALTVTQNTGYANANAFGSGTVSQAGGGQTITQNTGFADSDAFGSGQVSLRITGVGYADADGFGSGQVNLRITAIGFADPDGFGAGTVSLVTGPQTVVQVTGFANRNEFGTAPNIEGGVKSFPPAIDRGGFASTTFVGGIFRTGGERAFDTVDHARDEAWRERTRQSELEEARRRKRARALQDDDEVLGLIVAAVQFGVFNEAA